MISALKLIEFLGISSADNDYKNYLIQHRIYELPYSNVNDDEEFQEYLSSVENEDNIDDDDLEYERAQAEERAEESQLYESERDSVALIYEFIENYEALYPQEYPLAGNFVLKEFAVYAKGDYFTGYKGELPWKLSLNFSQQAVQKLLGKPIASRYIKELMTDLYCIDDLIVNITYDKDKISIIHFRKSNCYDQQMLGKPLLNFPPENDSKNYDATRWVKYFGHYIFSQELKFILPVFTEDNFVDEECDGFCELVDLKKEYGTTLFYNCDEETIKFLGFLIRRSTGYNLEFQGKKPFNLAFGMTLEQVTQIMGREADIKNINEKTVFANYIWLLDAMIIKTYFDLVDYQLTSIAVYDPILRNKISNF